MHCNNQREHICYPKSQRIGRYSGGELDLDMNGLDKYDPDNPVENVIWVNENKVLNRSYSIEIDNYTIEVSFNEDE